MCRWLGECPSQNLMAGPVRLPARPGPHHVPSVFWVTLSASFLWFSLSFSDFVIVSLTVSLSVPLLSVILFLSLRPCPGSFCVSASSVSVSWFYSASISLSVSFCCLFCLFVFLSFCFPHLVLGFSSACLSLCFCHSLSFCVILHVCLSVPFPCLSLHTKVAPSWEVGPVPMPGPSSAKGILERLEVIPVHSVQRLIIVLTWQLAIAPPKENPHSGGSSAVGTRPPWRLQGSQCGDRLSRGSWSIHWDADARPEGPCVFLSDRPQAGQLTPRKIKARLRVLDSLLWLGIVSKIVDSILRVVSVLWACEGSFVCAISGCHTAPGGAGYCPSL
ncbi:uncharacterized protein LOC134759578 [Pongo abelii]|uniref:uncharacterized protein LOC134759578 n=1 Tax=Pongo abelii TaxID=9601 RepID=UPI0030056C35